MELKESSAFPVPTVSTTACSSNCSMYHKKGPFTLTYEILFVLSLRPVASCCYGVPSSSCIRPRWLSSLSPSPITSCSRPSPTACLRTLPPDSSPPSVSVSHNQPKAHSKSTWVFSHDSWVLLFSPYLMLCYDVDDHQRIPTSFSTDFLLMKLEFLYVLLFFFSPARLTTAANANHMVLLLIPNKLELKTH